MRNKGAFTLIELIVTVTILAILWTIAFISLSWYSWDARDSKRISDIKNLANKINIEQAKGETLWDLIINTNTESGQILGQINQLVRSFGKANFEKLKENGKNFRDPSDDTRDYPLSYAIWGTWSWAYNFFQIATISEKENKTKIMWNYYKKEDSDLDSLFITWQTCYKEWWAPIYIIEWINDSWEPIMWSYSCLYVS